MEANKPVEQSSHSPVDPNILLACDGRRDYNTANREESATFDLASTGSEAERSLDM